MFTWAKLVMAVVLLVMPGGLLFLFGLALGRAWLDKLREERLRDPSVSFWAAMRGVSVRDVWRETRNVTGLPQPAQGH